MTTIEQLFEGSLDVPRRCGTGAELRETERYLDRHNSELEKILSPDARQVFSKYRDCAEERLFLYGRECYVQGFSLGMRLAAEALLAME